MDRLGTYRGYDIAVTLHSDGEKKTPKWHASIQLSLTGKVATEPCFTTEASDSRVGEARDRAIRIAKSIIDERPGAVLVGADDLSDD